MHFCAVDWSVEKGVCVRVCVCVCVRECGLCLGSLKGKEVKLDEREREKEKSLSLYLSLSLSGCLTCHLISVHLVCRSMLVALTHSERVTVANKLILYHSLSLCPTL